MIQIDNIDSLKPLNLFQNAYTEALEAGQKNIEAACLSTVSQSNNPHSRFINIKYINPSEFIFFSNFLSPKGQHINHNNNVALTFFWNEANIQIRVEGVISRLDDIRSDLHWSGRLQSKNALAISSRQSSLVKSYEDILSNYDNCIKTKDLSKRPSYWGGLVIEPSYFEFWQGHKSRLNKRDLYQFKEGVWDHSILQP